MPKAERTRHRSTSRNYDQRIAELTRLLDSDLEPDLHTATREALDAAKEQRDLYNQRAASRAKRAADKRRFGG